MANSKVKKQKAPRNQLAYAPILRKGGVHEKPYKSERHQQKQKLRKELLSFMSLLSDCQRFLRSLMAFIYRLLK